MAFETFGWRLVRMILAKWAWFIVVEWVPSSRYVLHKKDHHSEQTQLGGHNEDGDLCEGLCISISGPTISLCFLINSADRQISEAFIPHFDLESYHNLNTCPRTRKERKARDHRHLTLSQDHSHADNGITAFWEGPLSTDVIVSERCR